MHNLFYMMPHVNTMASIKNVSVFTCVHMYPNVISIILSMQTGSFLSDLTSFHASSDHFHWMASLLSEFNWIQDMYTLIFLPFAFLHLSHELHWADNWYVTCTSHTRSSTLNHYKESIVRLRYFYIQALLNLVPYRHIHKDNERYIIM